MLLTIALQLLIAANNPSIPAPLRQQAVDISNFAIKVANQALKDATAESVASTPIATTSPVASTPITASSTPYTSIASTPPPEPSPVFQVVTLPGPPPPPKKAVLISEPIINLHRFSVGNPYQIQSIEFTADIPVLCGEEKNVFNETINKFSEHCVIQGDKWVSKCDVPRDRYNPNPYWFEANEPHTCELILSTKDGVDNRVPFSFVTPD